MSDETRTVPFAVVDAFAAEPLAGAPVGVVVDACGTDEATMRALAAEVGVRETAFVCPTDAGADRRLRCFSPTAPDGEVDPGAHVAVATHARLLADGRIGPGEHAVGTTAGVVDVRVDADGDVRVGPGDGEPEVEPVDLDYDRAGTALGVDPAALRDVGADLPAATVSVPTPADPRLIVPVNFLERLGEADPDAGALGMLADDHDAAGVVAVTFDALDPDATLHARSFVPGTPEGGLPGAPGSHGCEEPATGAAAGAAGAYLHAGDAFDDDPPEEVRIEQGHFLDRPGLVRVTVADDGLWLGGRGVTAVEGRATLPAGDEDDIVVA